MRDEQMCSEKNLHIVKLLMSSRIMPCGVQVNRDLIDLYECGIEIVFDNKISEVI